MNYCFKVVSKLGENVQTSIKQSNTCLTKPHSDDQPPRQQDLLAWGGAQHDPPDGEEEAGQQDAHPAPEEPVQEAPQQGRQGGRGHSTRYEQLLPQGAQLHLPLQQQHGSGDHPGVVAEHEAPQGGERGQEVDETRRDILRELLAGSPLQVPGGRRGQGGRTGGGTGGGSRGGGGALAAEAGAGRSLDETPLPSVAHFLPPLAHPVAHTTQIVVMVGLLSRHMGNTTQHRTGLLSCI